MSQRGIVNHQSANRLKALRTLGLMVALGSCGGGDPVGPVAGIPTAVVAVSGDGQSGQIGTTLGQDFVAEVDDVNGDPVPGVAVTWSVTTGGGSINPTSDVTDANGQTQARLTLGPTAGSNTVAATVSGVGSVTFTGTGTTGGGGGGGTPDNVTFRTVDAGSYHTCAISPQEQAYCWGFNQDGQLGTGSTTTIMAPATVSGKLAFRQVSGGKYHSCAVTLSGSGYCWGSNLEGQLGRDVQQFSAEPVLNAKAITFATISVGRSHSCGFNLSGIAFCWGSNFEGQLGYVTTEASVDTAGFVGTAEMFNAIAAGGLHTCGITKTGSTLCWGDNFTGQLGTGGAGGSTPATVTGGLAFDSLTAGFEHTCALTAAGAAYCWGDNTYGQLGDGTTTNRAGPTAVSGGLTFKSISAGFYHTCGILTTGEGYCWGRNTPNSFQESAGGQLGDGTSVNKSVPTLVSGGLVFASLSAGEVHTCGVTTGNIAYCWGDNEYGNLGTGNTTSVLVPTKVINQP
jgi:alpha-tubulin suppressor-like RCC1 family protein